MKVTKVFMSMNKKRFCKTWNTNIHKTNTQQTDKRTLTNILHFNKNPKQKIYVVQFIQMSFNFLLFGWVNTTPHLNHKLVNVGEGEFGATPLCFVTRRVLEK